MLKIYEELEYARYTDNLKSVIEKLGGGVEFLRKEYEADYQGSVDVDILLNDGRVFSYYYGYGSCSGCDEWEARELSDEEIEAVILQECTIFDTRESYEQWRENVKANA